jgi:hypothetical protein
MPRELVGHKLGSQGVAELRASYAFPICRQTIHYQPCRSNQVNLEMRITDLATPRAVRIRRITYFLSVEAFKIFF